MKKFIIGGLVGMLVAFFCVVVVWWYLQRSLFVAPSDTVVPVVPVDAGTTTPPATETPTSAASVAPATAEGVPVRDLPLTAEQRQAAEALGFDVEQMVLSPALITCARETLGESRYQAILAGDTPTFIETARLLPCVGR
jgi:hypothetical protein